MTKLPKLRIAALAALALGVSQLGTAEAAEPAWLDPCDEQAYETGYDTCEQSTGGEWDWGIIWYTCDEEGNLGEWYLECYDEQ